MFSDKSTQKKSDTMNKETQCDVKKQGRIVKPFVSKEKVLGLYLLSNKNTIVFLKPHWVISKAEVVWALKEGSRNRTELKHLR